MDGLLHLRKVSSARQDNNILILVVSLMFPSNFAIWDQTNVAFIAKETDLHWHRTRKSLFKLETILLALGLLVHLGIFCVFCGICSLNLRWPKITYKILCSLGYNAITEALASYYICVTVCMLSNTKIGSHCISVTRCIWSICAI